MKTGGSPYPQLRRFFAAASEQLPIALAYLFGSRAIGREGPQSDYDIAVLFDGEVSPEDRYRLAHRLTALLAVDVDLIDLSRAPIELVYNVIASGQLLYEKDRGARVEFEAHALSRYFDALPRLRAERWALLEETKEDYDIGVERYREALRAAERVLAQIGSTREQDE